MGNKEKNMLFKFAKIFIFVLAMISSANASEPDEDKERLNILVYGATGRIGQVIVDEALQRGHRVTGVSRSPEKLDVNHKNFTAAKGDLASRTGIAKLIGWADAVIITISAKSPDNRPENSLLVDATTNVLDILRETQFKPYIVQIGGANLIYGNTYEEVAANMKNATFNYEPGSEMHGVLFGHQLSVEMYRRSNIAWTVVVPPMRILGIYGKPDRLNHKDKYRTSTSSALVAKDGSKTIYVRDLAKATIDEVENRQFVGQIFTAAY
ncbi:MAG: putative NADH-flavin reductase [Halioglobus sp.]